MILKSKNLENLKIIELVVKIIDFVVFQRLIFGTLKTPQRYNVAPIQEKHMKNESNRPFQVFYNQNSIFDEIFKLVVKIEKCQGYSKNVRDLSKCLTQT